MFIRPGSLALSFFIHFVLFILFLFYYSGREIMVAEPVKRVVVSLVLQQKSRQVRSESAVSPAQTRPGKSPATNPEIKEPVPSDDGQAEKVPIEKELKSEIPRTLDEKPVEPDYAEHTELVEVPRLVPDETEVYYLSRDIPLPVDEGPALLDDAPLLEDLLIEDNQAGSDSSLFSLELESAEARKILSRPEIVFDSKDPILATLENCRLSFTISKEGFVREASMISPGSGSPHYDEIIENLLSQFLFEPGRIDNGVISIDFYRVKESEDE